MRHCPEPGPQEEEPAPSPACTEDTPEPRGRPSGRKPRNGGRNESGRRGRAEGRLWIPPAFCRGHTELNPQKSSLKIKGQTKPGTQRRPRGRQCRRKEPFAVTAAIPRRSPRGTSHRAAGHMGVSLGTVFVSGESQHAVTVTSSERSVSVREETQRGGRLVRLHLTYFFNL